MHTTQNRKPLVYFRFALGNDTVSYVSKLNSSRKNNKQTICYTSRLFECFESKAIS